MNPWVEKYRPTQFNDIVLDASNRKILSNIIETSYFPNILLYGPPGTGKTTTAMNLINAYQKKQNNVAKDLIIHLNASDERGIDIIRNQISSFVNSKPLFRTGMKFVILDEVDYMTKNAQQALRYLLQHYSSSARFCLICNYITRIDTGLQHEFIRMRFNQLPPIEVVQFLKRVCVAENVKMDDLLLQNIQKLYKSDIRSMLNYIQINQRDLNTINDESWEELILVIKNNKNNKNKKDFVTELSLKYNIDKRNLIKDFLNYLIRNHDEYITTEFLNSVENLLHSYNINNSTFVNYAIIIQATIQMEKK
jgi:DNA polymerase III delta prime subunit